jgi:hypothetical protein
MWDLRKLIGYGRINANAMAKKKSDLFVKKMSGFVIQIGKRIAMQ